MEHVPLIDTAASCEFKSKQRFLHVLLHVLWTHVPRTYSTDAVCRHQHKPLALRQPLGTFLSHNASNACATHHGCAARGQDTKQHVLHCC